MGSLSLETHRGRHAVDRVVKLGKKEKKKIMCEGRHNCRKTLSCRCVAHVQGKSVRRYIQGHMTHAESLDERTATTPELIMLSRSEPAAAAIAFDMARACGGRT